MQIEYVHAGMEHVDEYLRLAKRIETPWNLVVRTPTEARDDILRSLLYLIRVEGTYVGFIGYRWRDGTVYISEIGVAPAWQGGGIGQAALIMVLEKASSARFVDLWVHPENPARHLYQRLGFVEKERRENYENSGSPRIRMVRPSPHKSSNYARNMRRSLMLKTVLTR